MDMGIVKLYARKMRDFYPDVIYWGQKRKGCVEGI